MHKKHILYTFAFLGMLILFNSCEKEYDTIENIDDAKIQAYIKKNNLTVTKDPSGIYYQIVTPGTGALLLDNDSVFYDFDIKSLDGAVYQTKAVSGNNGNFLGYVTPTSFRTAMLNLKRGGVVKVITPSHLAFGKNGNGNIPSNEVILSEITVFPQATQRELDDSRIVAFLAAKGITNAVKDPSGTYYQVLTAGTGTDVIDTHSTLVINYTGRLLNGTVFDSSAAFTTTLSGLIQGWTKIIPKFKQGAKVRLFIPSEQGYGNTTSAAIFANSILDFDVEITTVTN